MNILITGITGRIGSALAAQLTAAGHRVRGLVWPRDRRLAALTALDIEMVEGSLTETADVAQAVRDMDVILHLGAAFQGGGPFSNSEYFEINARGTFNMLEAAAGLGANLRQFVYASSDALYEKYLPKGVATPIREDAYALEPRGMYAMSKLLGEELCKGYTRTWDMPVTIFRFAMTLAGEEILDFGQFYLRHWLNAYAKLSGEDAEAVYAQLQVAARQHGENCLVLARDASGRSYKKHIAHANDIVAGILAGLDHPKARGQVFQLAAPRPFTWEQAVPYLAERLNLPVVDMRLAGHPPTYYEFDLAKATELLGFSPTYDIRTMIDDALALRAARVASV